jgi:hypothetical protein
MQPLVSSTQLLLAFAVSHPVTCSFGLHSQVTGGSALGIVSTGTDTLMATTVQPSLAGGSYSGAAFPGQQNAMNGGLSAMNGPQAESAKQEPAKARSSAGSVLASPAGKIVAGVLGLLLPAML